jgi:ferric-dicitrate binding protein FerR (iron transport regulator)
MSAIDELARVATPGSLIETTDGGHFELIRPRFMIVEVTPGSRLTLPGAPNRWFGRTVSCRVEQGEVRFLSGPDFPGASLEVTTPDGRIEMTGTIIAVNIDDTGTCVCVMYGTAQVGTGPDDMEEIPSGMRKVLPRDAEPFIDEIKPMHRDGLLEFDARHPEMHESRE